MSAALIKVAKQLAIALLSDEQKRNKLFKIIFGIAFFIFILVPVMAISLPGIIFKGLTNDEIIMEDYSFSDLELQKNKNYVKVRDTYLEYSENIDLKIEKRVEQLKKEYEYEVELTETLEDGTENTYTETRQPQVIKEVRIEKPELRHTLAYISTKYLELQTEVIPMDERTEDNIKYSFKKKEITNFLDRISIYTESVTGSDPVTLKVKYELLDIEQIAETFFTYADYGEEYKEKQEIFILSFESMSDYTDLVSKDINDFIDLGSLEISENGMKIPLMLQYDSAWGNERYGSSTITKSGCAILSIAMVEAYLKGKVPSPVSIANWSSKNNYYYSGVGTSWAFFKAYSSNIGIQCKDLSKNTSLVIKALEQGKPVIASMKPGTFTKSGHFIVLRGITENGKILVNDPNDNFHTKKFFEKEFSYSLIYSESKNFWSFE